MKKKKTTIEENSRIDLERLQTRYFLQILPSVNASINNNTSK
jgi:hypothetical protein